MSRPNREVGPCVSDARHANFFESKLAQTRASSPRYLRTTTMEAQPPTSSLCLHRDVSVSLEPLTSSSIILFRFQSTGGWNGSARVVRKIYSTLPSCSTEDAFRRRHIATSSAIFFRSSGNFPRCILWRVLGDGCTLELRAVDLRKDVSEKKEAPFILKLQFTSLIRSNGVALAAGDDQVISLFVVTEHNDLYTFALHPTFFCQANTTEGDIERWYKVSNQVLLNHLLRFSAVSPNELLLSFTDGRLARLKRRHGDDGSVWTEAVYNEKEWRDSLRSLNPWHERNTISFEGTTFDRSAAIAARMSPDKQHMVTVCMNHTLRFWRLSTGKPVVTKDLLDVERDPLEAQKISISPGTSKALEVFEAQTISRGDLYYALTYSTNANGLFKFWAVRDPDYAEGGVQSLFPGQALRVPDPDDGALWTVLDFRVQSAPGVAGIDVWILMRLNRRCRLYNRRFPDFQTLGAEWTHGWSVVALDGNSEHPFEEPPLQLLPLDPLSVPERWMRFLSAPGFISESVLETALSVYASSQDLTVPDGQRSALEKAAACVGSQVQLRQPSRNKPFDPYERMRDELNAEWTSYWQCVLEIEKARSEPMGLSFDKSSDMPWVVLGDGLCPIRDCSETEIIAFNNPDDLSEYQSDIVLPSVETNGSPGPVFSEQEKSALLDTAADLRSSFSQELQSTCRDVIDSELWSDTSESASMRIQSFYDQCDFGEEVSDAQFNALHDSLQVLGGLDGITTSRLLSILETLPKAMAELSQFRTTVFGLEVLTRGIQDSIDLHSRILHDLLYLTVFIEVDTDREQYALDEFDAARVYLELIEQLRHVEMLKWLASHTRPATERPRQDGSGSKSSFQEMAPCRNPTIVEDRFLHMRPQSNSKQSQSAALTQTIRDFLWWMVGAGELSFDSVVVSIQCNLLLHKNIDLATSFAQFLPQNAEAAYARGRLCLFQQAFTEAAIHFQEAADPLCKSP